MRMVIRDNVIWNAHLREDAVLYQRVSSLEPGQRIRLRIDGIVGSWEKMRSGANGVATDGLKPVGAMRAVWTDWQTRRGEIVAVEPADDEDLAYLDGLSRSMPEWLSAEDEAAYGKLRAR